MTSEMTQAVMNMMSSYTNDIKVALPGTIVGYNSGSGTVSVKPFGSCKKPDGTSLDYPILASVPIVQPAGIAVPVTAGMSCLLVICDIDIAGWLSGKDGNTGMWHNIGNAVCIPGLQKTSTKEQNLANAQGCVAVSGKLYVDGDVVCTGKCTASNIE